MSQIVIIVSQLIAGADICDKGKISATKRNNFIEMQKMRRGKSSCFCILLLVLGLPFVQSRLVLGCSDGNCPGQAQINWLISMQDLHSTGLLESYENNGDTKAWIHDQALAIIAFTAAGEVERARDVLDVMESLQRDDPNGAWFECYNAPNFGYAGCWQYITGPITWMVIAVNFYECRTGDPNYANMANRALGWMDTMMNTDDQNDARYGSLRYCENCDIPNAISTEHNIDAYSAYYWRGMLDANDSYLYKASLIMDYLRREMWAPTAGSNCNKNTSVFCRGYNDGVLTTDCQSWGVLSLGPLGPDGERFYESLNWLLDSYLQTTCDFNSIIEDVNGFKSESNEQYDCVRVDVTESVAAAFFDIGDDPNGIDFHNEMGKTADANGGLVHSFSCQDPNIIRWPENYRYNYVASVAWYYFNEVRLNPFNLRPCFAECRAANINGEGKVNFTDYAILALDWLKISPDLTGDINKDGRVHHVDLDIFTEYWLSDCNE